MAERLVEVVDDNDNIIGKATWREVHEKGLTFRAANVLVFNSEEKLFVHKRNRNLPTFPGMWDVKLGGMVDSGESYEEAGIRELKEEAGIENAELEFLFNLKFRSKKHNVNRKVYKTVHDGRMKLQQEELEEGKFLTIGEVKKLIAEGKVSASGLNVFEAYMKWKK